MRNDRVLIPVLHVAQDAKCFLPCVYSYFHGDCPTILFYNKNANIWVV